MTDIYDEIRYVPAMDYISRADLEYLADAIRARGTEPVPTVHRQLLDDPNVDPTALPPPSDGAIRAGQVEAAFKAAHPDCDSEAWITSGHLTRMVCKLHRTAKMTADQDIFYVFEHLNRKKAKTQITALITHPFDTPTHPDHDNPPAPDAQVRGAYFINDDPNQYDDRMTQLAAVLAYPIWHGQEICPNTFHLYRGETDDGRPTVTAWMWTKPGGIQ